MSSQLHHLEKKLKPQLFELWLILKHTFTVNLVEMHDA